MHLPQSLAEGADVRRGHGGDGPRVLQIASVDSTARKVMLPLIDRLLAAGYRVQIACSDGPDLRVLAARGYDVVPIAIPRQVRPLVALRACWRLYRLMRRQQYDVVHTHTVIASVLGRAAARLARVPAVFCTAHGFYFHEHTPRSVRWAHVRLERLLGRLTDRLFTVSREDALTAVRERILPDRKVQWVGNGVDVGRIAALAPVRQEVRKALGLRPESQVVGFVGRLVREKGVIELIEAMARVARRFPRAHLLVVGDTLPSDRDTAARHLVREAVERHRLGSRVVMTGHADEVYPFYHAMDIFVLPSHREGLPLTIMEAMAAGRPVVATAIRGCREQVTDGVTGWLVPVRNARALAEAIGSLLEDPARAREMGTLGQQRAWELFHEQQALDRYLGAYDEFRERSASRPLAGHPTAVLRRQGCSGGRPLSQPGSSSNIGERHACENVAALDA